MVGWYTNETFPYKFPCHSTSFSFPRSRVFLNLYLCFHPVWWCIHLNKQLILFRLQFVNSYVHLTVQYFVFLYVKSHVSHLIGDINYDRGFIIK